MSDRSTDWTKNTPEELKQAYAEKATANQARSAQLDRSLEEGKASAAGSDDLAAALSPKVDPKVRAEAEADIARRRAEHAAWNKTPAPAPRADPGFDRALAFVAEEVGLAGRMARDDDPVVNELREQTAQQAEQAERQAGEISALRETLEAAPPTQTTDWASMPNPMAQRLPWGAPAPQQPAYEQQAAQYDQDSAYFDATDGYVDEADDGYSFEDDYEDEDEDDVAYSDDDYRGEAMQAIAEGDAESLSDVLDDWHRDNPRQAAAFERQLEYDLARTQVAQAEQAQSVTAGHVDALATAHRDLTAEHADFAGLEPRMAQLAQENLPLLTQLESPSPAVKRRVLEALYVAARDDVTVDAALQHVAGGGQVAKARDPLVEQTERAMAS